MVKTVINKLFIRYSQYLSEIVEDFNEDIDSDRINWQHQCFESAILASGRLMIPQHNDCTILGDESKYFTGQCYSVSKELALADPNLIYCEGYAFAKGMNSSFPLRHAWLINKNGIVIDPTWGIVGVWYYGVPFSTNWVKNILTKRAKNDPDYDCSIFQANYLEQHSILQYGIPLNGLN